MVNMKQEKNMNTLIDPHVGGSVGMLELDEQDIQSVSGGVPAVAATAAVVALGGAALDLGYKLGGMLYRALH